MSTSAALSGAASGAAAGSTFGPVGTVVGGLVGGVAGLFAKDPKKPSYQPLDISKIITDARSAAAENYANSFALESQYRPGTAALRGSVDTAMGNVLSGNTTGQRARDNLLGQIGTSLVDKNNSASSNPLLDESASRILSNLRLGGTLGKDQQAMAVQAALQKGGAAGISGSGAARGLVARDLGLTSLGLENDRIAQARADGTTQAQLDLQGRSLNLQDFLGRYGAAQGAAAQDVGNVGLITQLVDARALPSSGLDPGAIASLYVADNNAKNNVNATGAAINAVQSSQNLNALLGLGSAIGGSNLGSTIGNLIKGGSSTGGTSWQDLNKFGPQ